jgi:hypothetical protein
VIILNHKHLRRMLRAYLAYYHRSPHASRPEQRRPGRQAGVCRFRPDHRLAGGRRLASPLRSSGRVSWRRDACRDAGGARRELCLLRRFAFEIRSGARRECPLSIDPGHQIGADEARTVFWRTTGSSAQRRNLHAIGIATARQSSVLPVAFCRRLRAQDRSGPPVPTPMQFHASSSSADIAAGARDPRPSAQIAAGTARRVVDGAGGGSCVTDPSIGLGYFRSLRRGSAPSPVRLARF